MNTLIETANLTFSFKEMSYSGKTKVYNVWDSRHGVHMGLILWHGEEKSYGFKKNVFYTLVIEAKVTAELNWFIAALMQEKKQTVNLLKR